MTAFLDDVVVLELGQRLGVGFCGSIFSELGAQVIAVEVSDGARDAVGKSQYAVSLLAGKNSLTVNLAAHEDSELVARLKAIADIIIISSDYDADSLLLHDAGEGAIVIDVTAFGREGPLAGQAYSDAMMQAIAGSVDTSGEPDRAPALCAAPIFEVSCALYATAGGLAALRARRQQGFGQQVEVAMFDCSVGMLATFLPKYFAGGRVGRIGNHHPGMSPWNTYPAKDGWVLLCAGTDDQWRRVCELIGCPDLITDARFRTNPDRVKNNLEADAVVAEWTRTMTIAECIEKLNAASISTGPILEVSRLMTEPNLAHREMVRRLQSDGQTLLLPGSPFRGSVTRGRPGDAPRTAIEGRAACEALLLSRSAPRVWPQGDAKPRPALAGVKVLEMGQFTTAPLVGRQLGALGADVVKLEPAGGEPSRHMPPHRNGQGFFFTLSNSEKRVMKLDLREAGRVSLLEELIAKADVLVENTKPGTLPRHGFTPSRVLEINPRIVYCAISGFGDDAPFAGLGAMDTTIQGLSGVMDLNREDGTPYKTGVSIADLHAGQFALVAVLAALEARDRTGKGQHIDLAMLDAAAWATRCQWMQNGAAVEQHVIPCADGYVLCEGGGTQLPSIGAEPRAQAVATMAACGLRAAPVLSLAEVMEHPQTKAKGVIAEGRSPVGEDWPLVTSPIVMSRTHTSVRRAPGALDFDAASVIDTWGLKWREAAQS